MRLIYFFIPLLFFCIPLKAQTDSLSIEPYDYDTILKSGYKIVFKVDDSTAYLYLKQHHKIITELSSCSRGLPYKNLGYVAADFLQYFVLAHSFGSGNPHNIELIEKRTGKNILPGGAAWIDVIEARQMLLYSEQDVPEEKDKMVLYNIQTKKKEFYAFPKAVFGEPMVLNRISISKLTATTLIIKYETEKGVSIKTYRRY